MFCQDPQRLIHGLLVLGVRTVGYDNFNFDSTIPVDVLRSLYLAPKVDTGKAPESSIEKQYGAKSVYDADKNTVAYSSDTKYPPVKLLPNAERKRILGESRAIRAGFLFVGLLIEFESYLPLSSSRTTYS